MSSFMYLNNDEARLDDESVSVPIPQDKNGSEIEIKGPLSHVYANALNALYAKDKIAHKSINQVATSQEGKPASESQQMQEAQLMSVLLNDLSPMAVQTTQTNQLRDSENEYIAYVGDNSTPTGISQLRKMMDDSNTSDSCQMCVVESFADKLTPTQVMSVKTYVESRGGKYFQTPKAFVEHFVKGNYAK